MKKLDLKKILAISLVSLLFVSCLKPDPLPTMNKKVINTTSTKKGTNTAEVFTYTYGTNFFVDERNRSFYDGGMTRTENYKYTYEKDKLTAITYTNTGGSKYTIAFNYDNSGKIIKQEPSTFSYSDDSYYVFQYNNDGSLSKITYYDDYGKKTTEYSISKKDSNGNVLNMLKTGYNQNGSTSSTISLIYTYEEGKENFERNCYPEAYQQIAFILGLFNREADIFRLKHSRNVIKTCAEGTTTKEYTNTFDGEGNLTKQADDSDYIEYTYKTI